MGKPGACPYCGSTSYGVMYVEQLYGAISTRTDIAKCSRCNRQFNYKKGKGIEERNQAIMIGLFVFIGLMVGLLFLLNPQPGKDRDTPRHTEQWSPPTYNYRPPTNANANANTNGRPANSINSNRSNRHNASGSSTTNNRR